MVIGALLPENAIISYEANTSGLLEADGGALYTISALWNMARERLDIAPTRSRAGCQLDASIQ